MFPFRVTSTFTQTTTYPTTFEGEHKMTTEPTSTRKVVRRKTPTEDSLLGGYAAASKKEKARPVLGGRKVRHMFPERTDEKSIETTSVSQSPQVVEPLQENATSTTAPAAKFKKKEKFEESHARFTTYIKKNNLEKLKAAKDKLGIPLSTFINTAIEDFLKKYQ